MKLKWTRKGEIEYECEKADARGKAHDISLLTKVYSWLSKSNRTDDLNRSFEDEYFQNKLIVQWSSLFVTEKYIVRGSNSIKLLINLINIAYSAMKILPYYDSKFSEFINDTPQELRMFISEKISNQIFFSILGQKAKQLKNADAFLICLNQLVDGINYAA